MFKKILNLSFNLPKFGTGGGINRHKYIIFFVIFLFSINIKSFGLEDPVNGVYQITSAQDLKDFAYLVNNGDQTNINAILTQDIEVISSTDTKAYEGLQSLLEGKEITNEEQKTALKNLEWTPIGNKSKPYTGNFNGNGKTISGLYFNDTGKSYVGLFGYVQNDGVIKNIGVKNSYFKANDYVGGLIGYFYVEGGGKGAVTSSYSSGCTVEGTGHGASVGGLIGSFYVKSDGTGEVTSSYSSGCTVEGGSGAKVGGLIGYFYVEGGGKGAVTSSYSGCTVEGGTSASVGGLIGRFNVGGTGEVTSSYSSGCTVEGGTYVGGLIGDFYVKSGGKGEVTSSYSSGCTVEGGASASVGGLIGRFYVPGTGEVTKCFYWETQASSSVGAKVGGATPDVTKVTDAEFEGKSNILTGTYQGGTVLDVLNGESDPAPFKQDSGEYGSNYPVHTWSNRVAYVTGFGVYREYVHPVDSYKLTQKIKIDEKEYSGGWIDSSGVAKEFVNTSSGSVTVFGAEKLLKIPVRVKINYDPSNKLETLVSKNFKHEFFRQKTGNTSWEEMLQNIHYVYTVSPVESSIKINPDGSKTQDFVFNYYIYHAQDNSGNDYKFGFNKKYPVNTYLRQDVGGGKKLYIDYGVWGRE